MLRGNVVWQSGRVEIVDWDGVLLRAFGLKQFP